MKELNLHISGTAGNNNDKLVLKDMVIKYDYITAFVFSGITEDNGAFKAGDVLIIDEIFECKLKESVDAINGIATVSIYPDLPIDPKGKELFYVGTLPTEYDTFRVLPDHRVGIVWPDHMQQDPLPMPPNP
jgi:hypothetical protein